MADLSPDKAPLAVCTIMQDEPEFLPVWLQHYAKQLRGEWHLYVLHHHDPKSTQGLKWLTELKNIYPLVNVIPVPYSISFDHKWLTHTVAAFQRFLLQSYNWVLFAEVDELIFVEPKPGDNGPTRLATYVEQNLAHTRQSAIACRGYEVVHQRLVEGPLTTPMTWKQERGFWAPSTKYSKPLLAREALMWAVGFHTARLCTSYEPLDGPHDGEIVLVHLHKMDFDIAWARVQRTANRRWSQPDVQNQLGWQNRLSTPEALATYFDTNVDTDSGPPPLEPIPDWIRDLNS